MVEIDWLSVCEGEGAYECMRGLAYSDMHTHRVYGMWVCAGAISIHIFIIYIIMNIYNYICISIYLYIHI